MTPFTRAPVVLLAASMVALYLLPLLALATEAGAPDLAAGLADPILAEALATSLRTSAAAMVLAVALGLPLAALLAHRRGPLARAVAALLDLPIALPPAVVGLALLLAFGPDGIVGRLLAPLGVAVPFTQGAVVLAQLVVASPFFVKAAVRALESVPADLVDVARTLGASKPAAFFRVVLPLAAPGLVTGLSLAWARALGEFGATLVFAGNLPGRTRTLPLAVLTALDGDTTLAVVLSLVAAVSAVAVLGIFRAAAARLPGGAP